jgi:arsenate reductase
VYNAAQYNHEETIGQTMSKITIYHNPRCSKSRQTLQLLEENGVSPEIVLYLETPPSADEINGLLKKLGLSARELLRKGEDAYKENNLKDTSLTDEQLVAAMAEFPKLIERPIVVKGSKAVLGRPPENVLELV